jgi:hypothetical protein
MRLFSRTVAGLTLGLALCVVPLASQAAPPPPPPVVVEIPVCGSAPLKFPAPDQILQDRCRLVADDGQTTVAQCVVVVSLAGISTPCVPVPATVMPASK